jgi:hypothetical protein
MASVDPAIQEAYEQLRKDDSGINYLLVGYSGNTSLVLQKKGGGGVAECVAALADDQCQYGCVRVSFVAADNTKRTKFATFSWAGPNSSVLRRGKMSVHKSSFKGVCKDAAVDIAVTPEEGKEVLEEEAIIDRIKKVNY